MEEEKVVRDSVKEALNVTVRFCVITFRESLNQRSAVWLVEAV